MSEDRFLIEATCLGDSVRSWVDPYAVREPKPVVLEMGDGNGGWQPIGTVSNIEGLEPAEEAVECKGRILVVGDAPEDVTEHLRFHGYDIVLEFNDLNEREYVKAIDYSLDFTISGTMEIREQDREKVLAMFGPPQIPLATSIGYPFERVVGYVPLGPPRGKKGKYKKDWMK